MPKDTRLTVRVEDEEIVIRLGINRLQNMTETYEPFRNTVTVANPVGWAQAVADQIGAPSDVADHKSLAEELFEAALDEASATGGRWLEIDDSNDG